MRSTLNTAWMNSSFHSHWFLNCSEFSTDDYLMFCAGGPL